MTRNRALSSQVSSFASRRAFLAGSAALAAVLPRQAAAELVCQDGYGVRVCESGIPSEMIHHEAAMNPQYQSQWCWAACIAMIFAYYGHPVSQARIVADAYGAIVDMPAMPATILAQLDREWVDDHGRPFRANTGFGSTTPDAAAWDLVDNRPLILGTQGHAVVLTSLRYRMTQTWTGIAIDILAATVRDPWPGRGRRLLRPDEWAMISFAAHVRVQSL